MPALRTTLASLCVLAAVLGLTFALQGSQGKAAAPAPAVLLQDEAVRKQVLDQMEQSTVARKAQGGPSYWLPEHQRAGLIEAWNRMRECARAHGFDGLTPVASTYGDGHTPAPIVFGAGPVADAALEACPFDTSLFDEEQVAAAIRAHPRTAR
jgi:hypothetical protein